MPPNPLSVEEIPSEGAKAIIAHANKMPHTSSDENRNSSAMLLLDSELRIEAEKELGETFEIRSTQLSAFRDWLQNQSHLAKLHDKEDAFLLRFLRSQKFHLEKSCKILEKYVRTRTDHPDWLSHLDPTEPAMIKLMDSGHIFALPGRDSSGRRVIVNDISRFDLSGGFTNQDVMKTMMATLEVLLRDERNQIKGFTYIFYCKNMTLAHCGIWTPSEATKAFGICEKNLPIRHADINLVHLSLAAWAVLEFMKQFLSAKIKGRIQAMDNNEKVAEKLGREILPAEWGGGSVPLSEMARQWREEVQSHKAYLLSLDSLTMVESAEERERKLSLKQENQKNTKKTSGLWSYIPGLR